MSDETTSAENQEIQPAEAPEMRENRSPTDPAMTASDHPALTDPIPSSLVTLCLLRQRRAEELAAIIGQISRGESLDGKVDPRLLAAIKKTGRDAGSLDWTVAALETLAAATELARGEKDPSLSGRAAFAAKTPDLVNLFGRLLAAGQRQMADLGQAGRPVTASAIGDVVTDHDMKSLRNHHVAWVETVAIVSALDMMSLAVR